MSTKVVRFLFVLNGRLIIQHRNETTEKFVKRAKKKYIKSIEGGVKWKKLIRKRIAPLVASINTVIIDMVNAITDQNLGNGEGTNIIL